MKKLAVITTHPIQYNAPFFRLLQERKNIEIKIFYTWSQSQSGKNFDPGFGKEIMWDIPLLEGYNYCFVDNVSSSPSSHHYKGIDNPTLIKQINKFNADAVLIYGWNFKSHFKAMRFFYDKIPVLFRGDSTLIDEKIGLKKIIRRLVLKYVYSFVNIALYAGSTNKQYFKAHGFKENALFFMPHAIDNNRFKYNDSIKEKAAQLRQSLNIAENEIMFLFAGKLDNNKNADLLASAFSQIHKTGTHLIITGNGKEEEVLKNKYSKISSIKFLDFQNQSFMPVLYSACDVYVLPSKSETWGLALNEAMAASKPVIASNTCGASTDLITNTENGFIFQNNNIESLKKCLLFFLDNKSKTISMGIKSLEKINNYSYLQDCVALENVMMKVNKK